MFGTTREKGERESLIELAPLARTPRVSACCKNCERYHLKPELFFDTILFCYAIDATRSQVTLVMTLVERAAGAPLGLYTACLATTLYLMLPMFNGADVVFRNVLVPIAGQREALLLKDAKTLAKNMVKQLPASRHGEAGEAIAEAFLVEAKMQK